MDVRIRQELKRQQANMERDPSLPKNLVEDIHTGKYNFMKSMFLLSFINEGTQIPLT